MHLGFSSSSSSPPLVQMKTVTSRITTTSGNSDNSRGRYLKNTRHVNLFSFVVEISFVVLVTRIGLNLFVSKYVCVRLAYRLMLAFINYDDVLSCKWFTKATEIPTNEYTYNRNNFSIYQTSPNTVLLLCCTYLYSNNSLVNNNKSFVYMYLPQKAPTITRICCPINLLKCHHLHLYHVKDKLNKNKNKDHQ